MAAEDLLQEGRRLEEERRLQEEAFQQERRNRRIEVVREISDLKKTRDLTVNRLRRLINWSVSQNNFTIVEDHYLALSNINSEINVKILDWEDLLDLDENGIPIYPDRDSQNIIIVLKQKTSQIKSGQWRE